MNAETTPKDRSRGQLVQRWLLGVVLAALVGVMVLATWTFRSPLMLRGARTSWGR